jgi:hypothetical protein
MSFRALLRQDPLKAVASRLGAAFGCVRPQAKDDTMPVTHPLLTQQQSLWSAHVAATMASIDGSQRLARMQWDLCQRWGSQTTKIVMDTLEHSSAVFAEQAVALQRSLEAPAPQAPAPLPVLLPLQASAALPTPFPLFGATQRFIEMANNLSSVMRSV